MGQDATKTQVEDFFKSNTFKENIKWQIQGGLLGPNIPYYVRGCTAQFVWHMRENPSAYEIPQVVQEGVMTTKRFSLAVSEILSRFCGELCQKIFGSIEDKTDIVSTGKKLAIQGFQLSKDHLKQYALLLAKPRVCIHAHEKTIRKEHDAAKALNKAQHAHDSRVADEQSALKTIEIKKQHQARLEQDVEAKKAALEQMQKRKETNDVLRDQKIAQLHTRNGTGGTVASDQAVQNTSMPVT
ncbi:hypothetical protein OPQ81_009633 [Rhizoctonia solani]|nr:hypothetical protein OPQ81_009633 [Rhizoctonia solani]